MNKKYKHLIMLSLALSFIMLMSGCSVTPDIEAPEPVAAPVLESPAQSAAADTKQEETTTSTASDDISDVIIVTEDYPPYNFINDQGELDGTGYKQVKEGIDKLGIDVEIQVLPWSRAYEMAQNDPNVLIFSMTRSGAREDMFKWISPLARQDVYLYALKGNAGNINISSLEDAKDYVVSAMNEDYTHLSLLDAGFEEGVNLSATPDMTMAVTQIFRGQTDVFISGSGLDDIQELLNGTEYSASDLQVVYEVDEMASFMYIAASNSTSDKIVNQFKSAIPGIDID